MKPSIVGAETSPKINKLAPAFEFDNVSFSYIGGENALDNIDLSIGRGKTLGVIGGTGSGKSTLVNLLCRFYDTDSGCVRINGADVRDYPTNELRKLIAIVPQKAELLSGTLRENMTLGRDDISDDRIRKAIEVAQASDFAKDLDMQVLQGGKNFSGGQKQRLTIARAVAQDPEILILDDSASALDYATDAALRKALRELPMTCVIVSQRANSIMNADKIIVLDDGKAVGIGTHAELLRTCEVYHEICSTQYSEEELAEQMGDIDETGGLTPAFTNLNFKKFFAEQPKAEQQD